MMNSLCRVFYLDFFSDEYSKFVYHMGHTPKSNMNLKWEIQELNIKQTTYARISKYNEL